MDGRRADREAARRFGRNLWKARRQAGYTQEGLGRLCSLHRTEIGRRVPRVDTFIKLASALDVRAEQLLEGIEWIMPAPSRTGGFSVENRPRRRS